MGRCINSLCLLGLFVLILGGIGQAAVAPQAASLADYPVRFAILGDRTGGHVGDVYDRVVLEIERLRPDFVMTVGDMIEGYAGDTAVYNEEWREYLDIVSPLTMPIHYTPGNHDLTNDVAVEPFKTYIGKPYYSFDHRGIHIVVLDNSRWESSDALPAEELAWLEDDLSENQDARWTMAFFHKPFWYSTVANGKPDTLHTLFKAYGVDAVFSGHFHQYFSATYDGIKYTAIGSSGASQDNDTAYISYHFGWVTVDDDSIHVNPIKMGSVLPWDYYTVAEMNQRDKVKRRTLTFAQPVEITENTLGGNVDISVTMTNHSPMPIDDTLRWQDLGAWQITPASLPISLPPGDSTNLSFNIEVPPFPGLFPTPVLSATVPYNDTRVTGLSSQLPVSRRVTCYRNSGSMVGAPVASETRLVPGDGSSDGVEPTTFTFFWNDSCLYLDALCHETHPDSVVTSTTKRDGPVYADDCVGYFIQPDPTKPQAYQIYFNSRGVCFDQALVSNDDGYYHGEPSWSCDALPFFTEKGEKSEGWHITIPLPWTALGLNGPPAAGSWMGINFRRKQHGGARIGNFQVPIDYDPKTFGRLYLSSDFHK